jgi:hypothetical protein
MVLAQRTSPQMWSTRLRWTTRLLSFCLYPLNLFLHQPLCDLRNGLRHRFREHSIAETLEDA